MFRRETTIDPEVAAELAQLDAALAGARVDDAALEALVRDVRAVAPVPAPAFRARMDRRVADALERPAPARGWTALRERRPRLVPALGAAASLLAVVAVVAAVVDGTDWRSARDVAGAGGAATTSAESAIEPAGGDMAAGGGSSAATPAPDTATSSDGDLGSGRAAAPLQTDSQAGDQVSPSMPAPLDDTGASESDSARRAVERAAVIDLTTPGERLQEAADGIVRATQDVGGYVATSSVATSSVSSGESGGTATFRLRVPSGRLDDALARLSKLAHVRALERTATDITAPTASTAERLLDARAERRGLQRALANATSEDEVARLRARLRAATSRVAALQSELDGLRRRAERSTIDVQLTASGSAAEGGGWSPGDAGRAALRVLELSAAIALVALAVALPLGLLAALGFGSARVLRRRRRQAALDGA